MGNELRVVGWYAIDHDGYEAIYLKENHVLRDFDAETVTANALVMLADADALLNAKCAEIERLKAVCIEHDARRAIHNRYSDELQLEIVTLRSILARYKEREKTMGWNQS